MNLQLQSLPTTTTTSNFNFQTPQTPSNSSPSASLEIQQKILDENDSPPVPASSINLHQHVEKIFTSNILYENYPFFLPTKEEKPSYSSVKCGGGLIISSKQTRIDWSHRACLFHNVGFKDRKIQFHENPNLNNTDWGEGFELDTPFVFKYTDPQQQEAIVEAYSTKIQILYTPIEDSNYKPLPNNPSPPCYIFCALYSKSKFIGHDYETIFSWFNYIFQFGMLSVNNQLVYSLFQRDKATRTILAKILFNTTNLPMNRFSRKYSNRFFPQILLIPDNLKNQMPDALDNAFFGRLIRDRTYFLLNLNLDHKNLIPRIGVRLKIGKHSFLNHFEILNHLKLKCPNCEIIDFRPEALNTTEEEISIISKLDIYITPGGGGSFSSIFLRDKSTCLYGNSANPNARRDYVKLKGLDEGVWDSMIHYFHYRIGRPTNVSDLKSFVDEQQIVHQRYRSLSYSLELSEKEFDIFIKQALDRNGFYPHQKWYF